MSGWITRTLSRRFFTSFHLLIVEAQEVFFFKLLLCFSEKQKHGFGFRLDLVKWVLCKTVKSFDLIFFFLITFLCGMLAGGYGSGGMMMSMQGKGPFTLTQWAELEQQALIYKYITANVPVPSSLLISIQKSFYPYRSFPPSSCKLFTPFKICGQCLCLS